RRHPPPAKLLPLRRNRPNRQASGRERRASRQAGAARRRAGGDVYLAAMIGEARVGTSGFSYREWVGTVYPPGLTQQQMLALYGSQVSGVEIQSRLPDQATLASWAETVPAGFEFALKLPGHVDVRAGKTAARAHDALLDVADPPG